MNVKQEINSKIKNSSEETKKILQIEKENISRVKILFNKETPSWDKYYSPRKF
jgi:hypothetical protein